MLDTCKQDGRACSSARCDEAPGTGPSSAPLRHFRRPVERPFTRQERDHVTLLFGGLTLRHDRLIHAALEGLGYKVGLVATPAKADLQAGKEFGNNGQCNPTYFTVGALVNHLRRLRDEEGLSTEEILSGYVFATAGTCGPCRFGMYEAEYRLALRNAGFDGFRVLVFDQEGGMAQTGAGAGIDMNTPFFLALLNAVFIGDLFNAVAYHIRPYETEPGKTDEVFERCLAICLEALRAKGRAPARGTALAGGLARLGLVAGREDAAALLDQLRGRHYLDALEQCRRLIDAEIQVDYTRPKPIVKVTGEFWAQTTEGEGNFNMFRFLEREGAEVLVETIATWADYMISMTRLHARDRRRLVESEPPPGRRDIVAQLRRELAYRGGLARLALAEKVLAREFERMRQALGGSAHALANQLELQRVAHPFYNTRSEGGEGHLEVAKNIYYINHGLAHMVLSLKPFGCMPSTQSDGAQAAVIANYPDMIYLPVETSGEGDINAYSRVQMALGEAKAKCKQELQAAVAKSGYALEDIRRFVAEHRELRRPLARAPRAQGVVGRAANFILHAAGRMDREPEWRARKRPAAAAA